MEVTSVRAGRSELLDMYRMMVRIRTFEEHVFTEWKAGGIPGQVHLYSGQEAVAAGVIAHLCVDDYVVSTHRGHGHVLAKGADTRKMMAESLRAYRRILPGQGWDHAHGRCRAGHPGHQRNRRGESAHSHRGGALVPVLRPWSGVRVLLRRRRLQPGDLPRVPGLGRRLEPARGLRVREQLLCHVHPRERAHQDRAHSRPRGGLRHAGRSRERRRRG